MNKSAQQAAETLDQTRQKYDERVAEAEAYLTDLMAELGELSETHRAAWQALKQEVTAAQTGSERVHPAHFLASIGSNASPDEFSPHVRGTALPPLPPVGSNMRTLLARARNPKRF